MSTDQPTPPGPDPDRAPDSSGQSPDVPDAPTPPGPAQPSDQPSDQPSSSTPPPPPPSYAPPPPPPPAGYAAAPPPASGAPTSAVGVGDAYGWAWAKFTQNTGVVLVGAVVYFAVIAIVSVLWYAVLGGLVATTTSVDPVTGRMVTSGGGLAATLLFTLLFSVIFFVLIAIMQAGIIRGALAIARGTKPEIALLFSTQNLAQILLAAVLVGIGTAIGSALCYIPGLIVAFYTWFTMFYVVDKNAGAIDAIKASVSLVQSNLSVVLLLFLAGIAAQLLGSLLCLIGLVVAIPVVILAQTYAYLKLQGEQVATA